MVCLVLLLCACCVVVLSTVVVVGQRWSTISCGVLVVGLLFCYPCEDLVDRVIVLLVRCILSVERRRCLGFMRRCGVHLESDHGHW